MSYPVFTVPASTTLYIPFATYDKDDGSSITMTGLAVTDIEIYKNGSATQRASDAGYTLLDTDGIDFDGVTGIHGFSVDLSDNTDAGFYAVGSWYTVVVSSVTVDAVTVNFIAAVFRIAAAEATAGYPAVTIKSGTGTGEVSLSSGAVLLQATQTGVTIPTVTTLTNLPAITSNWLTATGLDATAAAEIADAVWDEAATGHTDAGKAGEQLWTDVDAILVDTGTTLDTNVSAILADTGTDGVVVAAGSKTGYSLTATTGLGNQTANITGTVSTVTTLTNLPAITANWLTAAGMDATAGAEIADAVWDETLSGHLGAGSTGEALNAAGAAGDPWTTALPGAYGAGSAGKIIGDNINAPIATVDTVVDAIKVKTDYLPSATAGSSGGVFIAGSNAATSITTALTANVTGDITGNLSGSVGSVAAGGITAASIATGAIDADALAADFVDEILDEQIGDGTVTMRQALRVLIAGMAGKLSGAATTTVTIRNLADSANVVVATVDADGNRSAVTVTP